MEERYAKLVDLLEEINIDVIDEEGEERSLYDVLFDISKAWKHLVNETKNEINDLLIENV